MSSTRRLGNNFVLASTLALLSYLPFEYLAKGSVCFSALLFILDPFPPVSRLLALAAVVVVGILGRIERKWREGQDLDEPLEIEVNEKKDS
mmetsp:Transcript_22416/g.21553  ORF Transcript_22416/g.21553 Transcript_22416/m.21553 type:complete len:91 (-) Transcript_22416:461-733(-)